MPSGFLISKLGIALVVATLLGSAITMTDRVERSTKTRQLNSLIDTVSLSLREADSSIGRVKIRKSLPSPTGHYRITIEGKSKGNYQFVKIIGYNSENCTRFLLLRHTVNGGKFRIEKVNPQEIIIEKSGQIKMRMI